MKVTMLNSGLKGLKLELLKQKKIFMKNRDLHYSMILLTDHLSETIYFYQFQSSYVLNTYPADHDFCRFYYVLLVDQITVIGYEMCAKHQNVQIFVLKLNKY